MAKIRLLDIVRPLASVLPDVVSPGRTVPFNMKIMFSVLASLLYLSMTQIGLYGVQSTQVTDPLYSVRASVAASRGTLAELGVLPILTSSFLLQLLAGARMLDVNFSLKEERALFGSAQKLFAIIISVAQASALVLAGTYGPPNILGLIDGLAIVAQITAASIFIILLDEVIQKGHGLGSGLMLFIGANACTTSVWSTFSLRTVETLHGPQYEGAFIALLQFIFTWNSFTRALKEAFWRTQLPNILNVGATLLVIGACSFLQRVRVDIPVKHARLQGQRASYPIRLLYTGIIPLLVTAALRANLLLISATLSVNLPKNIAVRALFGSWISTNGTLVPVSGLPSYLVPPGSLAKSLLHPIHTLVYTTFNVIASAALAQSWVVASGGGAQHVAKQLQEQQLVMHGHREGSMSKELKRIIPSAAFLGGATVGAIGALGDAAGVLAGGSGVFIATTIVQTYLAMGMMESGYGDVPGAAMMMDSF